MTKKNKLVALLAFAMTLATSGCKSSAEAQPARVQEIVPVRVPDPNALPAQAALHAAAPVVFISAEDMSAALEAEGRVALQIDFAADRAELRPDAMPVINEVATLLKKDAELRLLVEGHAEGGADASGSVDLADQRANAVVHALFASGIAKRRLVWTGHASRPPAENGDQAGRARNGTIELVRIAGR